MKLIRTDVIIFILIFVITIAIVSFYILITPENIPQTINKNPIPQVNPGFIKNSSPQVESSCKTLLSCVNEPVGFCNQQCQNPKDQINYECKTISTDISKPDYSGNIYYNGTKVTDGQWCLPSFQDNLVCNTYMDSYIWSDYAGMQEWACYQSYPQFFNNEEYVGCKDLSQGDQNTNITTIVSNQNSNKLAQVSNSSNIYDPINDPNFAVKWNNKGPYAKDYLGNNLLECSCGRVQGYDQQGNLINAITVKLPNDPYNCHLNPCLSGGEYLQNKNGEIETGLNMTGGTGPNGLIEPICDCDLLTNFSQSGTGTINSKNSGVGGHYFAKSQFDGKCKDATVTCMAISENIDSLSQPVWDKTNNICICNADLGYFAVKCRSKIVDEYIKNNPNDPKIEEMKTWPLCKNYDFNELGSECWEGCNPNPCGKGTCTVSNNKVYCNCPQPQGPGWFPNIYNYCPSGGDNISSTWNSNNQITYFGQGALGNTDLPYEDEYGVIDYTNNNYVSISDRKNVDKLQANCSVDCIPSGQICGTKYSLLDINLDSDVYGDPRPCTMTDGCSRGGVWGGACCSGKATPKNNPKYKYGFNFGIIKDDGVWYYECE